ncbi:hypothetical protein BYZ73_19325 [Rhodovulum viride]|uniref:GAF domain-containing protein n=1 Tax=Rhodovulum viride TaxID=1231134 RepID=A0ABX9DC41_9RHOB|nr:hypothetical protein BYZ73_19325 [Rhodovulum viride]
MALVIGVGLTALGGYLRSVQEEGWVYDNASEIFYVGVSILLLTNLLLVFIDKQAIETLKSLYEEEEKVRALQVELSELKVDFNVTVAWLTLTKLMTELVDQAIAAEAIDAATSERLYNTVVEFIADYKMRIFGMGDDYLNISIYQFNEKTEELECIACYRSRPSDAKGPHRTWRRGEGHVGKAFELQNELICADARVPDVAAWVAAPPGKYRPKDREQFVSLAAVPIAIDTASPLGVMIMTSSEPFRFVNSDDVESARNEMCDIQRAKLAVAALQDIAAQVAQLMSIVRSKTTNKEAENAT